MRETKAMIISENEGIEDAYSEYLECTNCKIKRQLMWIKKGFLTHEASCPNCGCHTLRS
jgi:hypothetical protein